MSDDQPGGDVTVPASQPSGDATAPAESPQMVTDIPDWTVTGIPEWADKSEAVRETFLPDVQARRRTEREER
jgi:hypothetical protein